MPYQARETKKGIQVYRIAEDLTEEYLGAAPTIEDAEKMIADDVLERKAQRRTRDYDDDGKLIPRGGK